jgi:hypothetical protein
MYALFAFLFVVAGIATAFIPNLSLLVARYKIARVALWLSLVIVISGCIHFFAGIADSVVDNIISGLFNWGKVTAFFLVALLTGLLLKGSWSSKPGSSMTAVDNKMVVQTFLPAAIVCASFFFMVTIGKSKAPKEMEAFFVQSGYPASFNYVVMVIECLFSVGLLLHPKLRSGLASSLVLLLVMIGAVITHLRNGDPISDSYDALMQLLILVLIITILITEKRLRKSRIQ